MRLNFRFQAAAKKIQAHKRGVHSLFKDGDGDPSSRVQRSHSLSLACYHNSAGGTSQTLASGGARLISDIDVRRALRAKSRRYRKGTYTRRSAARPPAPLPSPDTCLRSKRFSRSLSDILGLLENSSCNVRMRSRDEAAPSTSVSVIRSVPTSLPLRKRRRRYTASSDMTAASTCRSGSQVLLTYLISDDLEKLNGTACLVHHDFRNK